MMLHDRLLDAHACDDKTALIALYTEAADSTGDINAACFYLTHAYIFALELGDPASVPLYRRLKAQGRV
nr:hypothetical protein [Roseobacter sp. CCS2]